MPLQSITAPTVTFDGGTATVSATATANATGNTNASIQLFAVNENNERILIGTASQVQGSGNNVYPVNFNNVSISGLPVGNYTFILVATQPNGTSPLTSGGSSPVLICFLAGTRIATPAGETAVEDLRPGDLVLTADGRAVAVRFIGRQTVAARFTSPGHANPIRIAAGALDENIPARDLFVSPAHGIVVDGVLAVAAALVNGTTIRQVDAPAETFVYYAVETATHEAILAEGCPAETFVDHVARARWDNAADHAALHPAAPAIAEMQLAHAKSRRQVPAATLARIAARAAVPAGAAQDAA
jgi:hypothetical protein